MAVLEINPAVRESLFVEDRNGKVKLDEGAFAEAFVENNHLICYNGIVYDQTGQALSSAEGQQAIYRLLRGLNVTTGLASRVKSLWEIVKVQAYTDHVNVAENQIAVQNGTVTVNLKTGECSFQDGLDFSLHRLNCNLTLPRRGKGQHVFSNGWTVLSMSVTGTVFRSIADTFFSPIPSSKKHWCFWGEGRRVKAALG